MNVSLTAELEKFVQKKVKSGLYQTASEVIRESLRLLRERDDLKKLAELRQDIAVGLQQAELGQLAPMNARGILAKARKEQQGGPTKRS